MRRLLGIVVLLLCAAVWVSAQDEKPFLVRSNDNVFKMGRGDWSSITFSSTGNKAWLTVRYRDNNPTNPPKSLHLTTEIPADTDICIEPAKGEKEVCVPFGQLQQGFAQ